MVVSWWIVFGVWFSVSNEDSLTHASVTDELQFKHFHPETH